VSLYLLTTPCEINSKGRKQNSPVPMIILTPSDRPLHINGGHLTLHLTEDDFLSLLLNPLYLKAPGKSAELSASGHCEEKFFPIQNKDAVENFRSIFRRAAPEYSVASDMLDREMALLSLLIKMKNLPSPGETPFWTSIDEKQGVWSIEDLADHIRNHFDNPLSLDEMALRCALNASYLSRSFKNKTGTTIFAYLNQIRIEKACLLLKNSGMTITEIAFSVGYNNISFFNRMFKRAMAMAPGKYRKKMQS
jgi:AraC-like DNA-binding protein